ncbi:MAG: sulfatase-like hydrolase/transferase, partial [Planctomycetota bacterium]
MKRICALLGLFCVAQALLQRGFADRPNVILVMCDDLGYGDLKCFNKQSPIQTPHLNEMADSGLKFNRFYAAAPVCSPTRGSCLTGRHPYRYGIYFANVGHLKDEELSLP